MPQYGIQVQATPPTPLQRYPLADQATSIVTPEPLTNKLPAESQPRTQNQSASLTISKKATSKTTEKKKIEPHYGLDYAIYRDRDTFPIDPRKPCSQCVRPASLQQNQCGCKSKTCNVTGYQGRPYMDKEPGGCQCATKNPTKRPMTSLYWPRPFSAKLDEHFPEKAAARYSPCQDKRLVDIFDPLSTIKLSKYKRTDNGYCGVGSDPYGCLGESKQRESGLIYSNVPGVGYRFPGEPNSPGRNIFGPSGN
jgi:hypothetical protein